MSFPFARPYFAAVRFATGDVFTGSYHGDAWNRGLFAGHGGGDEPDPEEGFLTNDQRFVTREEGEQLLRSAGYNLDDDDWFHPGEMHTKDVRNVLATTGGEI